MRQAPTSSGACCFMRFIVVLVLGPVRVRRGALRLPSDFDVKIVKNNEVGFNLIVMSFDCLCVVCCLYVRAPARV